MQTNFDAKKYICGPWLNPTSGPDFKGFDESLDEPRVLLANNRGTELRVYDV